MSLADELDAERPKPKSIVEEWVAEWYPTLCDEDRETFDAAVKDPRQSASALYRVVKRRGFPGSNPVFRDWVRRQRDTR